MFSVSISSIIAIVTAFGIGWLLLFYRPLISSSQWRATITPLASIMGSGFLVCAPLLYNNIGNFAVFAMVGLLCLAYAVGSVIRFNIRYAEPLLESRANPGSGDREEHMSHVGHRNVAHNVQAGEASEVLEKSSHIVLAGAYCVSVSYYLQLLANFALQPLSMDSALFGKMLVTVILAGIGAIGIWRGLKGIERLERTVVGINLAMISALLAGLIYHNIVAAGSGAWQLVPLGIPDDKLHVVRVLMGMLIVVQGFETSRFLGSGHSAEERINTMRLAQLISSGIYLLFIAMMAVVINNSGASGQTGITAIVEFSRIVAPVLPILITITAIGSQFAAATADDAGCAGLLESIFNGRIHAKYDYIIVSALAITLTWLTDVYEIISFASRAFAFYYALQCIVALLILRKVSSIRMRILKTIMYGILAVLCAAITLFGISAG